MGKKGNLLLISCVFIIFSISFALASDVAYIYKKDFRVDQNIIQSINDLGLSVDLIKESTLPQNLNSYKMLFVGDERFSNQHLIPVNDMPTLVANYYHNHEWGLTDREGASQLGATHPLSVLQNSHPIQVYIQAFEKNRITIPYYFLDQENIAPGLQQVAGTESTASGTKFGDVISYVNESTLLLNGRVQQENLCFFGIIESDYWTAAAKNMFEQCVGFVASECSSDLDCDNSDPYTEDTCVNPGEINSFCQHDQIECIQNSDCGPSGLTGNLFCSNSDLSQNNITYTCNNPGQTTSFCSNQTEIITNQTCQFGCTNSSCFQPHDVGFQDNFDGFGNFLGIRDPNNNNLPDPLIIFGDNYDIQFRVINKGAYNETGTIDCSIEDPTNLLDSWTKNFDLIPGDNTGTLGHRLNYDFSPFSDGNYTVSCSANILLDDNLTDNIAQRQITIKNPACFIDADCDDLNIYTKDTCINPGEANALCQYEQIICHTNQDCEDFNVSTQDICNNPGTPQSSCSHPPISQIACTQDLDCGNTTILPPNYCSQNNVAFLERRWTCNYKNTPNSYCSSSIHQVINQSCGSDFCISGQCQNIECFNHQPDCDDSNSTTMDICMNAGTTLSECNNNPINITCFTNDQCGIDGQIGNNICFGKNITNVFQTFTCNNKGTSLSYCSTTATQVVNKTCPFACSNGQCLTPTTYECSDGIDNDNDTKIDFPQDKGCQSPLDNDESDDILCSQNSDCGTDGSVGPLVCSGNNIVQPFQTFTCNLPGSSLSFCTNQTTTLLNNTCDFMCLNAQCIQPGCGNTIPEAGEQCDDGNTNNGDGCSDTCQLEITSLCSLTTSFNESFGALNATDYPNLIWQPGDLNCPVLPELANTSNIRAKYCRFDVFQGNYDRNVFNLNLPGVYAFKNVPATIVWPGTFWYRNDVSVIRINGQEVYRDSQYGDWRGSRNIPEVDFKALIESQGLNFNSPQNAMFQFADWDTHNPSSGQRTAWARFATCIYASCDADNDGLQAQACGGPDPDDNQP
ncbi:hypothetical protein CMI47_17625 [Candidatus Pacearchaeota archaeon]|nr:hypothetical protein [Candidatus Pacearchaeota archaeon]|tara:strand:+ start:5287 stop:8358 length:3072 start_codon:yes stop_codon:yes gene_type:complete